MGLADCINQAGLDKTLEKSFKRKLGPLPDTLQAGARIFLPFRSLSVPQTSAANQSHQLSLRDKKSRIYTYHPPRNWPKPS